jgi:hypothetical protein
MVKDYNSFIKEAINFDITYNNAMSMTKKEFIDFLDLTKGEFKYPSTPYMGGTPERKPQWIKDNFKSDEAFITLHPTGGKTSTSDEDDNDMYFISKHFFYKVVNVSDKEYDEIYMEYIFPYDEGNPSSPAIENDEEEIQ